MDTYRVTTVKHQGNDAYAVHEHFAGEGFDWGNPRWVSLNASKRDADLQAKRLNAEYAKARRAMNAAMDDADNAPFRGGW